MIRKYAQMTLDERFDRFPEMEDEVWAMMLAHAGLPEDTSFQFIERSTHYHRGRWYCRMSWFEPTVRELFVKPKEQLIL